MHFGYKYDYASRMLYESALMGHCPNGCSNWLKRYAKLHPRKHTTP